MSKRHKGGMSRRDFFKRSGMLGMAATAAGLAGGLTGCPAGGGRNAVRTYGLTAARAVLVPLEDGGAAAYGITLEGVAARVAWSDAATVCDAGGESLEDFLAVTWPQAFAVLPPHGALSGRMAGKANAVGFRVIVQELQAAGAGLLTGRMQTFDELWEDVEGFMRRETVVLENVTLHFLPTLLDEDDPEHLLVHVASSVTWDGNRLTLQGVSNYAGWLHNGTARLGGRERVNEHVARWEERYGDEPVEAWLWRTQPDGTPSVQYLNLFSGKYDSLNDRLTFDADEAKAGGKDATGGVTLFMEGGVVAGRPDGVAFENMRFTQDHTWVLRNGNSFRIGLTDFAQSQTGDIIFVDFMKYLAYFRREEPFVTIEAVKTVSDIYTPLDAYSVIWNDSLNDDPYAVNFDPYGLGWLMEANCRDFGPMNQMLTYEEYQDYINGFDK